MADATVAASSSKSRPQEEQQHQQQEFSWAPFAPTSHKASIGWQKATASHEKQQREAHQAQKKSSTGNTRGRKRPRTSPEPAVTSNSFPIDVTDKTSLGSFNNEKKNYDRNSDPRGAQADPEEQKENSWGGSALPHGITQTWNGATRVATVTFSETLLQVCLVGRARLKIVHGRVEVLGLRFGAGRGDDSPSCREVLVDSPTWKSVATIVSKEPSSVLHVVSLDKSRKKENANRTDTAVPAEVATFDICSPRSPTAQSSGVRPTIIPSSWELAIDEIVLDVKQAPNSDEKSTNFDVDGGIPITHLDSDDEEQPNPHSQPRARIVICGAKGVGKSTCLRYATNRFLSLTPRSGKPQAVAILDCDTGQPELSPPGMLTLTVVKRPMLHPPHVHMVRGSSPVGNDNDDDPSPPAFVVAKRHVEAYYYGHPSSKADPTLYMEGITKLVERYKHLVFEDYENDEYRLPLLVNTDGWVKGMGFQLLSALLDVVRPRHVVQLMGQVKSKMFELSSLSASLETKRLHVVDAYNNTFDVSTTSPITTSSRVSSVTSFGSVSEGMVVDNGGQETPATAANAASIPSLALRSLRLCTYFLDGTEMFERFDDVFFGSQGVCDINCRIAKRLAAMKPYTLPMDAVKYDINGGDCDTGRDLCHSDDMILDALNGAIVGLCKSTYGSTQLDSLSSCCLPCVGLGVIRGIDRIRRLFFILTPLHRDDLASVDVLLGGSIQLPLECLYRGVDSDTFTNLCCDGVSVGIGAEFMRSRNSLMRKSLGP